MGWFVRPRREQGWGVLCQPGGCFQSPEAPGPRLGEVSGVTVQRWGLEAGSGHWVGLKSLPVLCSDQQ